MADTIVNTPNGNNDSGSAGWFVAVIILLAVIAGGFYVYRHGAGGTAAPGTTNINVTVPAGGANGGAAQ